MRKYIVRNTVLGTVHGKFFTKRAARRRETWLVVNFSPYYAWERV